MDLHIAAPEGGQRLTRNLRLDEIVPLCRTVTCDDSAMAEAVKQLEAPSAVAAWTKRSRPSFPVVEACRSGFAHSEHRMSMSRYGFCPTVRVRSRSRVLRSDGSRGQDTDRLGPRRSPMSIPSLCSSPSTTPFRSEKAASEH